jgi:hypothetical protein
VTKNLLDKINFIGGTVDFINAKPRESRIIGIIILIIIIPLTVYGSLTIQHFRQYAESCVLRGDANGDGNVSIADVTRIERIILGLNPKSPGADANGDGEVNSADVTKTERIIMGLDPGGCVATPTPAPSNNTGGSSSGGSSGGSSSGGSSNNFPSCNDAYPNGIPDLFQINVNSSTVTLYYAPLSSNVTDYYISYGEKPGVSQFSINTKQGKSSGVLSYSINYLNPNSTYYFRIRGQNGCTPGNWSNEMKIMTGTKESRDTTIFYKNGQVSPNPAVNAGNIAPVMGSVTPTIIPTSTIKPTPTVIKPTPTIKSIITSTIEPINPTIEPTVATNNNASSKPKPKPTLKPTSVSHSKLCFLWWCW